MSSFLLDWIIGCASIMDAVEHKKYWIGSEDALSSWMLLILRNCSGFSLKYQEELTIGLDALSTNDRTLWLGKGGAEVTV